MRLYAIADISYIEPILSDFGAILMNDARSSLDGTKVIRCINHTKERMRDIFIPGTNIDEVLSNCTILTLEQAEQEMTKPEWVTPPEPGAMA